MYYYHQKSYFFSVKLIISKYQNYSTRFKNDLMILARILKPKQVIQTKLRLKHRIMSPISPPPEVRGITEWQPELFNTTALIPSLSVNNDQIGTVRKSLEKYLLKVNNLKPVQDCAKFPGRRSLLLNPEDISSFRDFEPMQKQLEQCFVKREHFR